MSSSDEDTYSTVFSSLKHPLRRKILRTLLNGPQSFSDLQRQINIESSHLTYHLEGLGNLLLKTDGGKYALSSLGLAAVSTMKQIEEPSTNLTHFLSYQPHRANVLKWLTLLLICGLIISLAFSGIILLRYNDSSKAYGDLDKAYNGLYQAFTTLNTTYGVLNQSYGDLNKAKQQLDGAYANLSQSFLALQNDSEANIVRDVNTGLEYKTIQEAINAAGRGDTIVVGAGVYYERLIVNKTLTILGADEQDTVVAGSNDSQTAEIVDIMATNVVFNGFSLRGNMATLSKSGVELSNSDNSTVSGNVITDCGYFGIDLENSSNNLIVGNMISYVGLFQGLGAGIELDSSGNNSIRGNFITQTQESAFLLQADDNNNQIYENTVEQNTFVILIDSSYGNEIYRNAFINNSDIFPQQLGNSTPIGVSWNVGGEGNYWDDYVGLDDGSGGRIAGDGIGDTQLPWHGVDYYPLIEPPKPISVFWDDTIFPVTFSGNSTVSGFSFDQPNKQITFDVIGPSNTVGYFNISIPTSLLSGPWAILLDGRDVTQAAKMMQNQTFTTFSLSYDYNSHYIQITGTNVIPEYPTGASLPFLTIAGLPLLAMAIQKRKRSKERQFVEA